MTVRASLLRPLVPALAALALAASASAQGPAVPSASFAAAAIPQAGTQLLGWHDFSGIDAHALAAPPAETRSVERLARWLTTPALDDLEKARAIYRWMTANVEYDTEAFFKGEVDATAQGRDVLRRRKAVCGGFSTLFVEMARAAGLEAVKVDGFAKGYGYQPGTSPSGLNHAWVAVRLHDGWYLIDPTWAAGHIEQRSFKRTFEDFWFLVPPAQLVFSHLPADPRWQLLPQPVERMAFQGLPALSAPTLFKFGWSADDVRTRHAAPGFGGFPEVYDHQGRRFGIRSAPLDGTLAAGAEHEFRLMAPDAQRVQVINEGAFIDLQRADDGSWTGRVAPRAGGLMVTATYTAPQPASLVFMVYRVTGD